MKTSIILLLFGVTCVRPLPNCSDEELAKCSENAEDYEDFAEEGAEESLENMCRYEPNIIRCHLDLMERCPNANFSRFKENTQEANRVYSILCDKSNPLRKKFLDNSRCLKEFMEDVVNICNNGEMIDFMEDKEACKNLRRVLACSEKSVAERCGEDAKEAYLGLQDTDFHLRSGNCL